VTLKPDLYAATASGDYEDHWFIEADRATEHLPTVLTKCRVYARYAATGSEQHTSGVFPAVLWVVPTEARAVSMRRAIQADKSLPTELFRVITTEQFTDFITASEDSS